MRTLILSGAIAAALVSGAAACAGSTVPPRHPSAAQYEAEAVAEEKAAQREEREFRPAAGETITERCDTLQGTVIGHERTCWTETVNPTSYHLGEAKKHHAAAAADRARSQAMRDVEARACAGVSEADRDMSPFHHREDIVMVERLYESSARGAHLAGAIVYFKQVPGMTAEHLQKIIDCHVARNDALGHVNPSMAYCPLVPQNVEAKVKPVLGGFAITIRSDDPDSIVEIVTRTERLVDGR